MLWMPCVAAACPQCFASEPTSVLHTYYLTTALLMLLPLVVVGALVGAGWSIRRQLETTASREQAKLLT